MSRCLALVAVFVGAAPLLADIHVPKPPSGAIREKTAPDTLVSGYAALEVSGQPILVTSDSAFEFSRRILQASIGEIERGTLRPALESILHDLLSQLNTLAATDTSNANRAARDRARAWTVVPLRLLGDNRMQAPASMEPAIKAELDLIRRAEQLAVSPVMGAVEDYSRYKPRGPYEADEALASYFRAQSWVSRQVFRFAPSRSLKLSAQAEREQMRTAFVIARAIELGADKKIRERIDQIDETLAALVGPADTSALSGSPSALAVAYGRDWYSKVLASDATLDGARAELAKRAHRAGEIPRVLDLPLDAGEAKEAGDPGKLLAGLALVPARSTPDAILMQALVWPNVGKFNGGEAVPLTLVPIKGFGPGRGFPSALDVLAALGSETARTQIASRKDDAYDGYATSLSGATKAFGEALSESEIYGGWLQAIRDALAKQVLVPAVAPYFLDAKWEEKRVTTAAAAWTGLRHSTVLYAKQSTTMIGKGIAPSASTKFLIEPLPGAYARLGSLHRALAKRLPADSAARGANEHWADALEQLAAGARKGAKGEEPGKETSATWSRPSHVFDAIQAEFGKPLPAGPPLVVDVHTDGNTGDVLEQGLEAAGWLEVKDAAGTTFRGPVYRHVEFRNRTRLTDREWTEMTGTGSEPKPGSSAPSAAGSERKEKE